MHTKTIGEHAISCHGHSYCLDINLLCFCFLFSAICCSIVWMLFSVRYGCIFFCYKLGCTVNKAFLHIKSWEDKEINQDILNESWRTQTSM